MFAALSAASDYLLRIYLFYVTLLMDRQAFHQPLILLRRHIDDLGRIPRPLETAVLKTFVQQQKSITFPQESFDPVSSSAAKQEKRIRIKRIEIILMLDDPGETIDAISEISVACLSQH